MTSQQEGRLLQLDRPSLSCDWIEEPLLRFAEGGLHADPKVGIPLYGPWSLNTSRHKKEVHVGVIGTGEGIEHATKFFEKCVDGIDGDKEHFPFPGCNAETGYRLSIRMGAGLNEKLPRAELDRIMAIKSQKERFAEALGLLVQKYRLLCERDQPIDYILVVLPSDFRSRCGVADYHEKGHGSVHRDLRKAFKARVMEYKVPSQIMLEQTLSLDVQSKTLDHLTKRAWNLFTGLYFKLDGLPWGPSDQIPSTCHVGISFFRPLGTTSKLRTSLAQAFDEDGEGLILRGHPFEWDEEKEGVHTCLRNLLAALLTWYWTSTRK